METATVSYKNSAFLLARTLTGEQLRIEPRNIVSGRYREIRPRQTVWYERDGDLLEVYTRDPRTVKETLDFNTAEAGCVTLDAPAGED
jgi:hypothetical protein